MGRIAWVVVLATVGASIATAAPKRDKNKAEGTPVAAPAPPARPAPPPAPPPSDDTPWGKGVSADNKASAQRLLGEGNQLFVVNNFREALTRYEAAVAAWDHPAIRFNMVRTLIALDRPLEAKQSLERALAFGKGPLEDDMYTEALNYQRLLAGQIAEYEVTCKQSGVQVKVDGENLLDCPGTKGKETLPGTHVIVGAKAGFMTHTQDVVLLPGKKQPIVIELITIQKATLYKQRWKTWKPWAIVGGGVGLAGLGLLLNVQANRDMDQLETAINTSCDADGCTAEEYRNLGFESAESRALTENRIAIGMIAAGGAVVIVGVIAVISNQPKAYLRETKERMQPSAQIAPMLGAGGGGVMVRGSF